MKKQSKKPRIWTDSKRSHFPWERQTLTDADIEKSEGARNVYLKTQRTPAALEAAKAKDRANGK